MRFSFSFTAFMFFGFTSRVFATGQSAGQSVGQLSGTSSAQLAPWIMPVIVITGMGLIALVLWLGIRQLSLSQKEHVSRIKQDEKNLQQREKLLLASALSAELTENKIKCETFITIYTELLRNLRELDRRATYEDTGDFIHQHPPLSRVTYDQNIEKLSSFSSKIASDLNHVYSAVRTDPQYFTLDATMPRAAAIRIVEMVIDDAQKTLEPIDPLIGALDMIIRDGNKTVN